MWVLIPVTTLAATPRCTDWVAMIVSLEGRVETRFEGKGDWQPAVLNDRYCAEDELRTLENSRAALQLRNDTIVRLDQNSMVKFVAAEAEIPLLLRLLTGKAFFMTRFPRPLTIETPFVNAASGGTEYVIEVDEATGSVIVQVIEGTVNLDNPAGRLTLTKGQSSLIRSGEAPVPHLTVTPKDALQWALYYPPVLNLQDLRLEAMDEAEVPDWSMMVRASIERYQAGDAASALEAVSREPVGAVDPRFYAFRASLLLSVGRVEAASADLEQALTLAPESGLARALQSIIAVVQNEPETTLQLALQAAQNEPESASVQIALSYAYQANFTLPEALAAARKATEIDPESALAWARSAELWMSQGYLDEALEAAHRAEALNPREVRYQTVLGFAYLTQMRAAEARRIFEQAVQLNSADPMPRLGLGLARIRQGDLEGGRQDIEIAAVLDPTNALIRSYLGKAYYEEKRDAKAAIQFELAKQLDPKDPTPYMYDAIRKQTVNRPVEAVHDMDEAIALNDNRAIYRSRLQLDQDLATRSVSRGRMYEDLGFSQRALLEGLRSVETDPANYSAYWFLSDSYAAIPHSDIARQSALLTSQLLQPLNHNPVQPSMSDDSILAAGSGVLSTAFNEYSQLMERDGVQLLGSGLIGEHDTWGDEIALSGVRRRLSWSLSQFRYDTDGWRENADIDQRIYDAFVQMSPTSTLSVQGEIRENKITHGDLAMLFDPDIFSPDFNKNAKDQTYRVGGHYAPTPTSRILVSAIYLDHEEDQFVFDPLTIVANKIERIAEAQYLAPIDQVTVIMGAGYYTAEEEITIPLFDSTTSTDSHHTNYYLYTMIPLSESLKLSIGGSYDDSYSGDFGNRDRFNPKLGLMWDISSSTALRVAGLRAVNRDMVANQTIEPAQFAGFQQFFQDPPAAEYNLYGVGLDHKFSGDTFGGIEFTKRDVEAPSLNFDDEGNETIAEFPFSYHRGRAYLYNAISNLFSATAEYFLDRQDLTTVDGTTQRITTHRVPLGMKFFHPRGPFAALTASYVDQDGEVINQNTFELESISSRFWVWDGSIGYRFSKRLGLLSIGMMNLTDRRFKMYQSDLARGQEEEVQLQPRRFAFAKLTLKFD
jgi:tetratricopeptide (TPR) repeat protein